MRWALTPIKLLSKSKTGNFEFCEKEGRIKGCLFLRMVPQENERFGSQVEEPSGKQETTRHSATTHFRLQRRL